jgi:hypothetical protein
MAARLHTNNVVGYFSIFTRGPVDTYRRMSEQHLERYPAKFDFRISTAPSRAILMACALIRRWRASADQQNP